MQFGKEQTNIVKGCAIILLYIGHLFFLWNIPYQSIFFNLPGNKTIEYVVGSSGGLSVAIFLFLSGYGMYFVGKKTHSFRDSIIRSLKIWGRYIFMDAVFIPIGIVFFGFKVDYLLILKNFFLINFEYNKFAWFIVPYIIIIILFPITYRLLNEKTLVKQLILLVAIKISITLLYYILSHVTVVPNIVYKTVIEPLMLLPFFMLGYIFVHNDVYKKIYLLLSKMKYKQLLWFVVIFMLGMMYLFPDTIIYYLSAPVLCFLLPYLITNSVIKKILRKIGELSSGMWLTHFFILVFIGEYLFRLRISLIILVAILAIAMGISFLFNLLFKKIKI